MKITLILALFAGGLLSSVEAQTPSAGAGTVVLTPSITACASSFYAAGSSFNKQGSPQVAEWAAISTPLTKCGSTQPLYSITLHSLQLLKDGNIQDSTTTGVAFPVRTLGPVTIMLCGTGGASTATATTFAYSGCALALVPFVPKWKLEVIPWFQILKGAANTSTTWGLGLGRSF